MLQSYGINLKEVLKIILFVLGVLLGVFIAYKLSLYLAPFIIAFLLSSFMEPVVKVLVYKVKVPRKVAASVTLLVFLCTLGLILVFIFSRVFIELRSIYQHFPEYYNQTYNNIIALIEKSTVIYEQLGLPVQITKNIEDVISNYISSWSKYLSSFLNGILTTAVSLPQALVFTLVTILSTFFLTSDKDMIYAYCRHQFPDNWVIKIRNIKNDMFSALFGYIKAQLIMMTITFTELCIGFLVIGVSHPFLLASIISLIDALPIIGTGSILIPWSVYSFLIGDIRLGISLLILYGIVLAVRQMIEPKILSQQIGLYPLVTLIAMYTGLKLLGVAGLILGPITILLLKNILSGAFKNGIIKEIISRTKSTV